LPYDDLHSQPWQLMTVGIHDVFAVDAATQMTTAKTTQMMTAGCFTFQRLARKHIRKVNISILETLSDHVRLLFAQIVMMTGISIGQMCITYSTIIKH
jgi:hypothetical protein